MHLHIQDLHIHIDHSDNKEVLEQLLLIIKNQQTIMTDVEQAVADLKAISAQLQKIGVETSASLEMITALEEAAANQPGLTQELKDAIADVKNQAQVVDEMVPDTPTEETGAPAEEPGTESAATEGLAFGTGLPK